MIRVTEPAGASGSIGTAVGTVCLFGFSAFLPRIDSIMGMFRGLADELYCRRMFMK